MLHALPPFQQLASLHCLAHHAFPLLLITRLLIPFLMSKSMSNPEHHSRILHAIAAIPAGKVCTYGKIAELAGLPRHARLVGRVLKNLPPGSRIPWHRVINSQGRSSFPEGTDAWHKQLQRLEAEGVILRGGKFDLREYLWIP